MVKDLYFFAKCSPAHKYLSYWHENPDFETLEDSISFNLDKLKFKNTNDDIFLELAKELTYQLKESEYIKNLYSDFNGSKLRIKIVEDFHHCCIFDDEESVLYLDSKINSKLAPLYLFAVYFGFARHKYTANQIYQKLFDFLLNCEFRSIKSLYEFVRYDNDKEKIYDPGSYFQSYLKNIYDIQCGFKTAPDAKEKFKLTQLLRNRTLAGKLPYDLKSFENLLNENVDLNKDLFSGDVNQELFDIVKDSYEEDYGKLYYQNLGLSLRAIGMKIVAQRGSRVAHEQGPILVNSLTFKCSEDFLIKVKKLKSHCEDYMLKLRDSLELAEFKIDQFQAKTVEISVLLDSLVYLIEQETCHKARFKKETLEFYRAYSSLLTDIKKEFRYQISLSKELEFEKIENIIGSINSEELLLEKTFLDLMQGLDKLKSSSQNAVIYIQRISSRSGHFVPRLLLGQKLYVETDADSETNRVNAIPFNFVCHDLDLIADNVDSFFENASISIVTNKDTGVPQIKWENAEDLAKTLAPSFYKAIEASYSRLVPGKKQLFHYQLETTLLGPLIDLFKLILENEISNIASVDNYIKTLGPNHSIDTVLEKYLTQYSSEINKAADYVVKLYLLENQVEEIMLREKTDRSQAIAELLLSLRDVQFDCFALMLKLREDVEAEEKIQALLAKEISAQEKLDMFKDLFLSGINKTQVRKEIKDKLYYPISTAIKEFFVENPNIKKIKVSSNKNLQDLDYVYNFSVAPSRIDFGKHVVASITTLMGRMIGADDQEALKIAKDYIDCVSQSPNSIFSTASEAGSVKVIENTCRAIQYAKAISFQGAFQAFNIDGMLARQTINSRNTKEAGLHVMEFGTMASTGYCITKEPLFILLGLSLNSEEVFTKLGIQDEKIKKEFKSFFSNLLQAKSNFDSMLDWQLYVYEELASSVLVQSYIADPKYKILPKPDAMLALLEFIASQSNDNELSKLYNKFSSELIEVSRLINETGIIQRIQLVNNHLELKSRSYKDLKVLFNASYKGNVSDERENANQYMMALLLHKKEFLKNSSNPQIAKLLEGHMQNHDIPKEIKVFDPYVDKDIFMGGELENIAKTSLEKLVFEINQIDPNLNIDEKVIEASFISFGSDLSTWQNINSVYKDLEPKILTMASNIKLAELYFKGFYKNAQQAFQNLDIAFLNSDHDEQKKLLVNLVNLKELMQINNPDSLLTLVDNPQQAKKPFFDQDLSMEWIALGGTVLTHMIAPSVYDSWAKQIKDEANFAKLFVQVLIMETKFSKDELIDNDDYQTLKSQVCDCFVEFKRYADLKRDLLQQKFYEAREIQVPVKILERYQYKLKALAHLLSYEDYSSLTFIDWLSLGGRWILNGKTQQEIDYIIKVFNDSAIKLGKLGHEVLSIFVQVNDNLCLEAKSRKIDNSGSTKEADLLMLDAKDSLEQRSSQTTKLLLSSLRYQNLYKFHEKYKNESLENLGANWDNAVQDFMTLYANLKDDFDSRKNINIKFAQLLKITEFYSQYLDGYCENLYDTCRRFVSQRFFDELSIQEFFGDHKKSQGLFKNLSENILLNKESNLDIDILVKFAEMIYFNYLVFLTIDIDDENEMINKLAIFFDQYLNVHEEDYPPYMFHSLCAGSAFGFDQTYFYDTNLRVKMFKLACKSGIYIYKHLYNLITTRTVLRHCSAEYKDSLIGDYENGLMPICYQHETICIEERLWDCMRALRNFVRNYHDRHPLPVVIKSQDAKVEKLFRYGLDDDTELVWIAGLASPGKHSWDLNCVFRSPDLRKNYISKNSKYANISVFAPYLTTNGQIKQIYTAFAPEVLEGLDFEDSSVVVPFEDSDKQYELNSYGYVHAIVDLVGDLPEPDITMSAHTHEQYISGFTAELGIPEVWSLLSMKQMYAKTELSKILSKIDIPSLAQVEFLHKEFDYRQELVTTFEQRLANRKLDHIEYWIVKASRDSGGRGISGRFHIRQDKEKIIDFIFDKTKTDDVVLQEFVPNNARAFINSGFYKDIVQSFVNSGLAIDSITPYEQMYFAMRAFQSFSGIKGYLFSVNLGTVTVNAGQGAKLFFGEPIGIMPIYIAGKIIQLLDEEGDRILKEAIPEHAKEFAREHNIKIVDNVIGSNNCYMLNGLFDYIPYVYIERLDMEANMREFKVIAEDNAYGGLDFYYSYFGKKVLLISKKSQEESVLALEELLKASANQEWQGPEQKIDINLAKIELNSGLGQANLLQKTIEESAPEHRDLFLEWTEDLGVVAIAAKKARR